VLNLVLCSFISLSVGFVVGTVYGKKLVALAVDDVKQEVRNLRADIAKHIPGLG